MENEYGEVLNPDLEIIISQVYITPVCSNVFYLHIEYCCEIWGNIYKNNTVYIAYTNVHKILNHADCFMNTPSLLLNTKMINNGHKRL